MRERSGRSGRRLGSQKPGTACGAACGPGLITLWACASPDPSITASGIQKPDNLKKAQTLGNDVASETGIFCNRIAGVFWEINGLIDHPADNASFVIWRDMQPLQIRDIF